jgi:hypothetical protein
MTNPAVKMVPHLAAGHQNEICFYEEKDLLVAGRGFEPPGCVDKSKVRVYSVTRLACTFDTRNLQLTD